MARVHLALLSGCLWVGPAGGPLAYARGSVEVRGEEEESAGAHRFCDLAEGRLPPGGVVRQGAISWVMFSVFCWFCLGLCWVYVGFLDRVPRVMSCVFNHFWVISTVWSFSGLFRPRGGRLPPGEVAGFGAPAPGDQGKRARSVGCRTSPHSFIIPICQGTEGVFWLYVIDLIDNLVL